MNLLFTLSPLVGKIDLIQYADDVEYVNHVDRETLQYAQPLINTDENEGNYTSTSHGPDK